MTALNYFATSQYIIKSELDNIFSHIPKNRQYLNPKEDKFLQKKNKSAFQPIIVSIC